jgi:hypothetical protein
MNCVTTVSELAGQLAARASYTAQTADKPARLGPLANAYTQHVHLIANYSAANPTIRRCPHVESPPYIVVTGSEDRAWCIECVKEVLRNDNPLCAGQGQHRTRVFMFPFSDTVVAGHICPDCGEGPAFATATPDQADS